MLSIKFQRNKRIAKAEPRALHNALLAKIETFEVINPNLEVCTGGFPIPEGLAEAALESTRQRRF